MGLTISHDLSWVNHILKSVSKAKQNPSLAHLNSYPPTRPSFTATWSTALPSGLALLPRVLLSLTPWKPRPSRLLESPVMKLSLWVYHYAIADRSVVSLSSTAFFLVLHPLLFPCFVSPRFLQDTESRITAHLH